MGSGIATRYLEVKCDVSQACGRLCDIGQTWEVTSARVLSIKGGREKKNDESDVHLPQR
jgi:hypothetical protein